MSPGLVVTLSQVKTVNRWMKIERKITKSYYDNDDDNFVKMRDCSCYWIFFLVRKEKKRRVCKAWKLGDLMFVRVKSIGTSRF